MKTITKTLLAVVLAMTAGGACAEHLRPEQPDAGASEHVTNTDHGDGTTTTRVDATRESESVYLDLESKSEVWPATPESSSTWDLGFQRFAIKVNGGVSGTGGMQVAALPGADFAALTEAPASGYVTDAADGALAFLAGDGWYSYDSASHTLSPRDVVYVVRSTSGNYYKLSMTGYYDDAGTSGFPTFRWGSIAAPPESQSITVDASDAAAWVYLGVSAAGVVTVADPTASTEWDLALSRTRVQTNGGTSGSGLAGARLAPAGATFDSTADATTIGFRTDQMVPLPGPPGSGEFSGNPLLNGWYDYDQATHVVTSKQAVYLVRTATGAYGKLQILDYADGVFTLRLAPVARAVTVQTSSVDASDAASWVYLDLRMGELVSVDPASSTAWDLGLSRTQLRTNSETSGPGGGGAADPSAVDLPSVTSSAGEYAGDAMLPLPGPPGSGEYSGNPVLAGWYDYDPVTHVVSPKNKAYLVRTADGGFVKAKITTYSGGLYTIDWAYAGAGRSDFQEQP